MWQHPLVNVFRLCDVDSWRHASRQGDVTTGIDRDINKKVIRVRGSVPAANCVTLPRDKNVHTLNLKGRYLYIHARFPLSKYFVIHVDVLSEGGQPYRVSISNLYNSRMEERERAAQQRAARQAAAAAAAQPAGAKRAFNTSLRSYGRKSEEAPAAEPGARPAQQLASSSGNSIQLAFPFPTDRWTMIALNLPQLLHRHLGVNYGSVRSLQFCASMDVRACFTSDAEFTMDTAPRDVKVNPRVAEMTDTIWLPEEPPKMVFGGRGAVVDAGALGPPGGAVRREGTPAEPGPEDEEPGPEEEEVEPADDDEGGRDARGSGDGAAGDGAGENGDGPDGASEDEDARDVNGYSLSEKRRSEEAAADEADAGPPSRVLMKPPPAAARRRPVPPDRDAREPDGVDHLSLSKVIGFGGNDGGMGVIWAPDCRTVLYNVGSTIVCVDVETNTQRFLYGHTDSVSCAAFSVDGSLLATGQTGRDAVIRLWKFRAGGAPPPAAGAAGDQGDDDGGDGEDAEGTRCVGMLCEHASGVSCIDISQDGRALTAVGLDGLGRQTIVVWDIASFCAGGGGTEAGASVATVGPGGDAEHNGDKENIALGGAGGPCSGAASGLLVLEGLADAMPKVLVRHGTEYHVARIRFSPFEEDHLMTCGRDSIRVYRFRNGKLRGCSVKVGETKVARTPPGVSASDMVKTIFTDLAFEIGYGITSLEKKHVFVSSVSGSIYQINYGLRTVECIYQLHNSAINSVAINEGFCVTASDDNFVRVWPMDFSDYFLEAEHESGVSCVNFSGDGLQLCACTDAGSVGVLDIPSQKYSTLVRSHTDSITAMSSSSTFAEFVTASNDTSIRVWSVHTGAQLFEFRVPSEVALCVDYHPARRVIAVGFDSGCVRVFDIESTTLIQEHRQHDGAVLMVEFSGSGSMLVSGGAEGNVCVYSPDDGYLPVKFLATSVRAKRMLLSISPDSRLLATVGLDSTRVLVFDTSSLGMKHKIVLNASVILDMKFSPDSDELYVLTQENCILRFGVASGLLTAKLPNLHRGVCDTFAIDRQGRLLVAGGRDGSIKVWECASSKFGRQPQSFIGHGAEYVAGVCFVEEKSTADKYVLSAAGDAVHIWRVNAARGPPARGPATVDGLREAVLEMRLPAAPAPRGRAPEPLPAPAERSGISANLMTSTGRNAALSLADVVGYDGRAARNLVWNARTGEVAFTCMNIVVICDLASRTQRHITKMVTEVNTMAICDRGGAAGAPATVIATGAVACDGTATVPIHVWDVETCRCVQILRAHTAAVRLLEFSPDGNLLLSVDAEGAVAVWDLLSSSLVCQTRVAHGAVTAVSWIPDIKPSFQFIVAASAPPPAAAAAPRRAAPRFSGLSLWTIQGGAFAITAFSCAPAPGATGAAGSRARFESVARARGFTAVHLKDCWSMVATDAACGLWFCNLREGVHALEFKCELDAFRRRPGGGPAAAAPAVDFLKWSDGGALMAASGADSDVLFIDVDLDRVDGDVVNRAQLKKRRLELDGLVRGVAFDFDLYEGVVGTDRGSIWYINSDAEVIPIVTAQGVATERMIVGAQGGGSAGLMVNVDLEGGLNVYDMDSRLKVMSFGARPPDGDGDDGEDDARRASGAFTCTSLAVSPSGGECVAGFDDGRIRSFSLSSGGAVACSRRDAAVLGLTYDASSARVVAGTAKAEITVLAAADLAVLYSCVDPLMAAGAPRALAIDFCCVEGNTVAAVMYPSSIEVYELQQQARKVVRVGISRRLQSEELSSYYLSARPAGAPPPANPPQVLRPSVSFSRQDRSTLIYLYPSIDGAIHYFNYLTGILYRQLKVIHAATSAAAAPALLPSSFQHAAAMSRQVYCMALSGLGDVAVGCCDGVVAIYNRREQRWECVGIHPGVVMSMAFSASGRELWTTTISGAILVWRTRAPN